MFKATGLLVGYRIPILLKPEYKLVHFKQVKSFFFRPSDSAPKQDPLLGVSVVMGLLALLCIVVFAVVRRRMITSNKQGTPTDV